MVKTKKSINSKIHQLFQVCRREKKLKNILCPYYIEVIVTYSFGSVRDFDAESEVKKTLSRENTRQGLSRFPSVLVPKRRVMLNWVSMIVSWSYGWRNNGFRCIFKKVTLYITLVHTAPCNNVMIIWQKPSISPSCANVEFNFFWWISPVISTYITSYRRSFYFKTLGCDIWVL